jgi:hypothetical protein
MEPSHVLAAISKGELKGAPGLAFETWDPSNQSPLETPTFLFVFRPHPGFPHTQLSHWPHGC